MSKTVLFFHIVNSIHQKTNLYILFYHLNLDMHGPTMRPDFHEGIPFQQVSGNFVSQHPDSVTDPFQLDPPTKVLLPSVTQANRRQSSAEKQRKETARFFHHTVERWELLLQTGALLGCVLGFWPAGKGVGCSLVCAGAVVPVSSGHRITVLVAHCHHLELRCHEQRLCTWSSELR